MKEGVRAIKIREIPSLIDLKIIIHDENPINCVAFSQDCKNIAYGN